MPPKKTVAPKKTMAKPVAKAMLKAKVPAKLGKPAKPIAKKTTVKTVAKPKVTTKAKPTAKVVAKKPAIKAPVKPAVKKIVPKQTSKTITKPAAKVTVKKAASKVTPKIAIKKAALPKAKLLAKPVLKVQLKPSSKMVEKKSVTKPPTPAKPSAPKKVQPLKTALKNMPYEPTDTEAYMNSKMVEFFRKQLMTWRDELLEESSETLHNLHEEGLLQKPDLTDRASEETDRALEFRTRDRERKLINKINAALSRIDDGSYGYCEETGDAIGVKRLLARPVATMTVEAQERHERIERTQRDAND